MKSDIKLNKLQLTNKLYLPSPIRFIELGHLGWI